MCKRIIDDTWRCDWSSPTSLNWGQAVVDAASLKVEQELPVIATTCTGNPDNDINTKPHKPN